MSNIRPAVPDPPEVEEILWKGFDHTALAFDIGANCGQSFPWILDFADQVVAFEPSFESIQWINDNIFHLTDGRVNLEQAAISSHTGEVTLYAVPEKISTGQLVSDVKGMEWHVEGKTFGRHVLAYTLDDAVEIWMGKTYETPGFIKIDVEGHEWEILRKAPITLGIVRPEFLIEIHDMTYGENIRTHLSDYNYNYEIIRHPHYEPGSALWATHYWIKAFPDEY